MLLHLACKTGLGKQKRGTGSWNQSWLKNLLDLQEMAKEDLFNLFRRRCFFEGFFSKETNNSPKTTSLVCPDKKSTCQEFARRGTR